MLDESARLALAATRFSDVRWHQEVDSTNRVAADLVRHGAGEGLVVVADHQSAGRGRRGRRWEAPPGTSLLVSIAVRAPSPGDVHLVTGAVALAAVAACSDVAGVEPGLKWPNDLVIGDGKVGGILGEVVDGVAVVGLGLNVNWEEAGPPPSPGVALDAVVGAPVDRPALLVALLRHLDGLLAAVLDPQDGSARFLREYRARSATLGREVLVDLGAETVEGRALDITAGGHLVVQAADGRRRVISAGDVVHVRPGSR
jgi:BirA family biotin operon repressor/biotin-[acetyl-CoA-carboxylase] ligase